MIYTFAKGHNAAVTLYAYIFHKKAIFKYNSKGDKSQFNYSDFRRNQVKLNHVIKSLSPFNAA